MSRPTQNGVGGNPRAKIDVRAVHVIVMVMGHSQIGVTNNTICYVLLALVVTPQPSAYSARTSASAHNSQFRAGSMIFASLDIGENCQEQLTCQFEKC